MNDIDSPDFDPSKPITGLAPHVPGPPGKPTPDVLLKAIQEPKPVPMGETTTISFAQVPVFDKTRPKIAMTLEECTHIDYVIKFRKLETPDQVCNALDDACRKGARIEVVYRQVNSDTFTPMLGIAVYQETDKNVILERLVPVAKFHYHVSFEALLDAKYCLSKKAIKHLVKSGLLTKEPKKSKTETK